jgi:hypothetical protein
MFVDDEGLKKGDWQILGQADGWRRDEWAPPLFSFALDQITWSEIREYPDGDPFGVTRSRRTPRDEARQYPGDGIQCRAGAEFEFDLWALPNNEAIQSWAISFGDGMSKSRPEDHAAYNAPADGDWFALRLDQGGWGLGRVARTDGFLMVAYLFKRRFEAVPELTRIQLPSAADAILAQRTNLEMSPLGEVVWLGCGSEWDPTAWPIPRFKHEIRGMGEHAVGLSYTFDPFCLGRVVACRRATIVELESLAAFKQFTLFGMAFWLDAAIDPLH